MNLILTFSSSTLGLFRCLYYAFLCVSMKIVTPLVEKLKTISGLYISKNGQNWQRACVMGWYLQRNLVGLLQQNISLMGGISKSEWYIGHFCIFFVSINDNESYHFASAQIKAWQLMDRLFWLLFGWWLDKDIAWKVLPALCAVFWAS